MTNNDPYGLKAPVEAREKVMQKTIAELTDLNTAIEKDQFEMGARMEAMEEALRFYAEESGYLINIQGIVGQSYGFSFTKTNLIEDAGKIARAVLAKHAATNAGGGA